MVLLEPEPTGGMAFSSLLSNGLDLVESMKGCQKLDRWLDQTASCASLLDKGFIRSFRTLRSLRMNFPVCQVAIQHGEAL